MNYLEKKCCVYLIQSIISENFKNKIFLLPVVCIHYVMMSEVSIQVDHLKWWEGTVILLVNVYGEEFLQENHKCSCFSPLGFLVGRWENLVFEYRGVKWDLLIFWLKEILGSELLKRNFWKIRLANFSWRLQEGSFWYFRRLGLRGTYMLPCRII